MPDHLKCLFVIAYHCGNRLGELRKLTWKQVDFESAEIRIEARQARMQQGGAQQGAAPQQGGSAQPGQAQTGPFDRLAHRADAMAKTSAALKKVADTGAPLYQSLTDAQKERFKTLARVLRPHPRRFAFNERNGGWQRGERGMGHGMDHGGFGRHHGHPDGDGNGGGSQL